MILLLVLNGYIEGNGMVDRINVPVLILQGDNDTIISKELALENKQMLKNAELHIIENCGHAPTIDQPQALIREIISFI